ncbi:MAG: 1-phosphatidylinositol phosphodiesterase [Planctomycetota bacterium]|jgi:1-phosphatidylinositol phosphodiesterase
MNAIPDSTKINRISIPGTHDSGSDRVGTLASAPRMASEIALCQAWDIREQLDAGIRFLDIRIRPDGDVFTIQHGAVNMLYEFGEVMEWIRAFLAVQESECILMRVMQQGATAKGADCKAVWNKYMVERGYGDLFWQPNPGSKEYIPKLGEVRGKVVALRNHGNCPAGYGIRYDWCLTQDTYQITATGRGESTEDGDRSHDWTVTLARKHELVRDHLRVANASAASTKQFYLNYASGTGGLFAPPSVVANSVLPDLYATVATNYASDSFIGIVAMDYPGSWLIYRIIQSNFP